MHLYFIWFDNLIDKMLFVKYVKGIKCINSALSNSHLKNDRHILWQKDKKYFPTFCVFTYTNMKMEIISDMVIIFSNWIIAEQLQHYMNTYDTYPAQGGAYSVQNGAIPGHGGLPSHLQDPHIKENKLLHSDCVQIFT